MLLRLLSETDGAGQTVSFGYDPVGRATTEIAALDCRVQTTATMIYDLAGNLLCPRRASPPRTRWC